MNSDESAFEGNGFNLQTSFNIWRSGKVQQQLHVSNSQRQNVDRTTNLNSTSNIISNSTYFTFYNANNQSTLSNPDSNSSIKTGMFHLFCIRNKSNFLLKNG